MKKSKEPNQLHIVSYCITQGKRNIFGDIVPPEQGEYYIIALRRRWYSPKLYLFILPNGKGTFNVHTYMDAAYARRYSSIEEAEQEIADIKSNPNNYILV